MQLIFALEPLPNPIGASVFLAGPTPRDPGVPSWRPEALRLLVELGYRGAAIVPEPRSGEWRHSYVDQTSWEVEMRARADLIAFWVPRELTRMPAFTTNVEFGEDYDSCRCLYGRPEAAPKNRYLDVRWRDVSGRPPHEGLRNLLGECAAVLGDGASRSGPERDVPLGIWRSPAFTAWHTGLRETGHSLRSFRLLHAIPDGKRHPASAIEGFLAEAGVARANGEAERLVFLARREGITLLSREPVQ